MENNALTEAANEDLNNLEPAPDLDRMEHLIGKDPADLSEGFEQTTATEDGVNNNNPDNVVTEKIYKDILEDEANAVVGSE